MKWVAYVRTPISAQPFTVGPFATEDAARYSAKELGAAFPRSEVGVSQLLDTRTAEVYIGEYLRSHDEEP